MKTLKGFVIGAIVGGALMLAGSSLADSIRQYMLSDANYPVYVNNGVYLSEELPIMNYEGYTYIPMRAVGEVLGATVVWNDALHRAEITYGDPDPTANNAFRKVKASGADGVYTITGEARVFEGTMNYAVSDGHSYLLEDFHTVAQGAPSWSPFTLNITVDEDDLPLNGTLTIELFEYSAEDGSRIHEVIVPLQSFE